MVAIGAKYVLMVALLAQAALSPAGAEDKAKAKALLTEGLTFNRQGAHAQALEKFQAAYAAFPSPKLFFNIGQVQVALDHPVEAAHAYEKFLALVPDAQPEDKKVAKMAVAQLAKKLGRLQIRCETGGAEVVVDGKNVGRVPLPGPLWAAPGGHQVTLSHESSVPATETVEIGAGATTMVVIRLVPAVPPAPAAPPPPSEVKPTPEPAIPPAEAAGAAAQPATETVAPSAGPPPAAAEPAKDQLLATAAVPSPIVTASPAAASPALDLSARPTQAESQARPFYKTWWFWTGAAVVVGGAVTAAVLLTRKSDSNVPGAPLGNHEVFQ
jgi:hypothetical protein